MFSHPPDWFVYLVIVLVVLSPVIVVGFYGWRCDRKNNQQIRIGSA